MILPQSATTEDEAAAAEFAEKALAAAADAMEQLAAVYAEQAIGMRRGQSQKLTTWFGVHLGDGDAESGDGAAVVAVVQHGVGAADVADDRGERGAAELEGGRRAGRVGRIRLG